MKTADFKLLGIAGIVFGLCNIIPVFADARWYAIFSFLLLGIPEIVMGIFTIGSSKPKMLRAQSWENGIAGLAIFSLALSSFYASPSLAAFNFIAVVGLVVSGVYGLIVCNKKFELPLVP